MILCKTQNVVLFSLSLCNLKLALNQDATIIEAPVPFFFGLVHLYTYIFCLYSCLRVSRKWHDIITEKPHYLEQIKSHFKGSTENAKKLCVPLYSTSATRKALCTISNHLPVRPQTFLLPKSAYKAELTQKHRPCPTCGSPARELNLRRTICTNRSCQMDFCQMCFRRWHEGQCAESGDYRSPKRKHSTLIAGSEKSRKRLRRL